jgi:hypothetical protein
MAAFSVWLHQTLSQQQSLSLDRRRRARALWPRHLPGHLEQPWSISIIGSLIDVDDIDDPRLATLTRTARYETITCLAEDNLRAGRTVLLVAPFTEERKNLDAWEELSRRLRHAGALTVTMVWLDLSRDELLRRMHARGADRDADKLRGEQRFIDQLHLGPPVGPHIPIHAVGPVDQLVHRIMLQLRADFSLPSSGLGDIA